MTQPFSKQQTAETISQNADLHAAVFNVTAEAAEASRRAYRAERTKAYRIALINAARARGAK